MSQSKYSIVEAVFVSSAGPNDNIEVDIKANVMEFTCFEHIAKAYIDARIIFIDDFGLQDQLNIRGTERFRITFGDLEDDQKPQFTKFFFVGKIASTKKINERSQVIVVDLVEDILYVDAIKQISRAYTGTIENIIELIAGVELNRNVERVAFKESAQGIRKIIVPYMSPLETISWIKDRATTKTGGPIYLHANLFTDTLYLSEFDSLMKQEVVNAEYPLRYTKAGASVDDKVEMFKPYFEIINYSEPPANNMLAQYEAGNVGSYYSNIDSGTGVTTGRHVTVRDIVQELYLTDVLDRTSNQQMFDDILEIDGKLSDDYNSLNIFQVTSSKTYNQFQSYHDEATLIDDNDNIYESNLKVKNKIIRAMLKKNIIDIGVDGRLVFESLLKTGNSLRALFLNPNSQVDNEDISSQLDNNKSGDYFIMAISHTFDLVKDTHYSTLRMSKLNNIPKDVVLESNENF